MKDVLKAIWLSEFNPKVTIDKDRAKALVDKGLVKIENGCYILSPEGRTTLKVVVAGGAFDILHPGHGFFMEKAKEKGDILIVIVARDTTVEKRKRIPIVPEEQRREMVSCLKGVDAAILGREGEDFLKIIEDIEPDIIALGPDQHHRREPIKDALKERGIDVEVVRIREYKECEFHSSRKILQRCMERGYPVKKKEDN